MVVTRSATRGLSLSDSEQANAPAPIESSEYDDSDTSSEEEVKPSKGKEDEYESVSSSDWNHPSRKRLRPLAPKSNPIPNKRAQRGGQRKTHVYRIPVPPPAQLERIRKNFERPRQRQVWGVLRDNFCAVEDLWATHYGWDLSRIKVEMDYGELVRNIGEYRKLPAVDGKTCDRCSARGQTTNCKHNYKDACKSCLRNNVECTVTMRKSLTTVPLRKNVNDHVELTDPDAIEVHFELRQQPPVRDRWKAVPFEAPESPPRRKRVRREGPEAHREMEHHPTNGHHPGHPGPEVQVQPHPNLDLMAPMLQHPVDPHQQHFVQQPPFHQQFPYAPQYPGPQNQFLHGPQFLGQDQGRGQQRLRDNRDQPKQPTLTSLSTDVETLRNHVNYIFNERIAMWAEIVFLRAEVERLNGSNSRNGLMPMARGPAPFEGPAPFPVPARFQTHTNTTGSYENSPTTPGFVHNPPPTPLDGIPPFAVPAQFDALAAAAFESLEPRPPSTLHAGIVPTPVMVHARSAGLATKGPSRSHGVFDDDDFALAPPSPDATHVEIVSTAPIMHPQPTHPTSRVPSIVDPSPQHLHQRRVLGSEIPVAPVAAPVEAPPQPRATATAPATRHPSKSERTNSEAKPSILQPRSPAGIHKRRGTGGGGTRDRDRERRSSDRLRQLVENIGDFDGTMPRMAYQGPRDYVEAGWTPQSKRSSGATSKAEAQNQGAGDEESRRSSGQQRLAAQFAAMDEWTYGDPTLHQLAYPPNQLIIPGVADRYDQVSGGDDLWED
ncbi:hypothetical protein BJX76DRAFT_355548 [Aspergillus varians]